MIGVLQVLGDRVEQTAASHVYHIMRASPIWWLEDMSEPLMPEVKVVPDVFAGLTAADDRNTVSTATFGPVSNTSRSRGPCVFATLISSGHRCDLSQKVYLAIRKN